MAAEGRGGSGSGKNRMRSKEKVIEKVGIEETIKIREK
jgi:hypothetical protein